MTLTTFDRYSQLVSRKYLSVMGTPRQSTSQNQPIQAKSQPDCLLGQA